MSKEIIRNNWISLYLGWESPSFKISPYSYFDERAEIVMAFIFFQIFIHLPIYSGKHSECEYPSYGFSFFAMEGGFPDTFIWSWGKSHHYDLPWHWEWVRTSTLLKDNAWFTETKKNKFQDADKDNVWQETHDYTYTLKSGKTQERKATIKVVEREWRWRCLQFMPLIKLLRKKIEVEFNDEVGERSGSWKGGTIGCSYDLIKNETPWQCLRRMESERKFN